MSNTKIIFDPNLPPEYYLLDVVYQVRTADEALVSKEHVEMFGTPSTGFAKYDRQLIGSSTVCYLSIDRLVKINEKGYRIELMVADDAYAIYTSIHYYLSHWKRVMDTGINKTIVPYELLGAIDRFAQKVYPSATTFVLNPMEGDDVNTAYIASLLDSGGVAELQDKAPPKDEAEISPIAPSIQDDLMAHQIRWMR